MTKPLERCTKAEILAVFAQRIEELNAAREELSRLRADNERLRRENEVLRQDAEATDDYETQHLVREHTTLSLKELASTYARNHRCVTQVDTARGVVQYYDKTVRAWRDVE